MSRGGRPSRGGYGRNSAYPYRGQSRFSQHDSRQERDNESGEHYYAHRNSQRGDYYKPRGGGRYRGGSSGRRGRYSGRRPRSGRYSGGRGGRGGGKSVGRNLDEDGDVEMEPKARPGPYDRPQRRPYYQNDRREKPRGYGPSWNLITVVSGASLDQDWLINTIRNEAMIQCIPVQYHLDGNNACFCIEDDKIALEIKDCNKKISTPDGQKLTILRRECLPPVTDEQIGLLKKALSDRYNTETLHLDASCMYFDKLLKENRVHVKLGTPRDLTLLINIISEHISGLTSLDLSENRIDSLVNLKRLVHRTPHLKRLNLSKNFLRHMKELDNIKEWDLTDLSLDGNALCEHYKTQTEYISSTRDRFPNLLVLDGTKLPPPVKFDIEKKTKLIPPLTNHMPDSVTQIIKEFVKQYFSMYDTNRESLMQAYHKNCMFSLCIPTVPRGAPLSVYYPHSRNFVTVKSAPHRNSLLQTSQDAVCAILRKLPKTEHDLNGFCVDVPLVSPTLLKFVIRGVFREKNDGKYKEIVRAFTRAFLCLTDGTRLSIINEELFIRNTTRGEFKSAFLKPPVTPSPSPVPEAISSSATSGVIPATSGVNPAAVTSPSKVDMISAFSKESGMNANFSEQCLAENSWDYKKAGQTFLALKQQGRIPPEAFISQS